MNVVSLYIYTGTTSKRLELFSDEKISVTSAVSNFNDLGKIYTDFTQSFTIPASKKNNKILSHWYESSIDNGYDHRKRYDAYIEVNSVLFKKGNIQLEKANKKNGFIESYTVTFYGNLTQLKDKFKDDKLNTLDFSSLNHTYNSTNIINRINPTGTSYLVSYPLIGSRRKFYYKSGASHEDITQTAGAIQWNELFPAITTSKVFELIQNKYGVTFTGSFFSLDQWSKLYLYLKNADVLQYKSEPLLIDFTSKSGTQPSLLDLPTNVLTTTWDFSTSSIRRNYVELQITTTSTNYRITVTDNNLPFATYDNLSGNTTINVLNTTFSDNPATNNFRFYFSSETSSSFTSYVKYEGIVVFAKTILVQATSASQTVISNIAIKNYVPDITVNDFITGIIKAFNLMIIPKDINTFEFLPLEMYYNAGKILDITKYVYADEMEIERPKLFKAINFQYEKSNNILNNAYRGLYNTEYGDLIYTNTNSSESSNYEIKLPFENVLFERATGYNFETATIIDKDLKPYTPKPMLIYNNGELPTDLTGSDRFYVTTETGHSHQNNYIRFSNEYNSVPTDATFSHLMTMNFGDEQSPWYNVLAPKGLYFRHYKNYIDNLYNIKTRVIKCKALFPTSLLNSSVTNGAGRSLGIALNDRLVIRNKRYIINNMTIDLTTGEANLELITDYRGVNAASSVGYRYASYDTVQVDKTAQVIDEVIYLNDYDYFSLIGAENFLVYDTIEGSTTDQQVTVTISANSGADRTDRIGIEYYIDSVLQKTEYINFLQTAI
jgi:hypothetical protein